jgi:hypothetical protein
MTGRQRDRRMEGIRDGETGRQSDWATGREFLPVSPSPRLPVSLPLCLFLFSLFLPLIADAQTGEITGKVVSEDGGGMPNVMVYLSPVGSGQRAASNGQPESAVTDRGGNFKFTGLAPRQYSVNVDAGKGYINRPVPTSERGARRTYRPGDQVTITLVRGGVITGRVTTPTGDPMIGVQVSAMMVKDFEGNPLRDVVINTGRPRITDDRGVYRIYGLAMGTYVVFTRGNMSGAPISAYDGYAPTYHPSSTRETAAEIAVTSGGEATGVDIRYRGERGYTVSGVVTGPALAASNAGTSVALYNSSTGFQAGTASIRPGDGQSGFAILGVTDGEYEIIARRYLVENEYLTSPPRRITVKGGDLGGIELRLSPSAMVSGKVVEASPKVCEGAGKSPSEDVSVFARRATKTPPGLSFLRPYQYAGSMNDKGEFIIYRLDPDSYFIIARLPDENRYVKSIAAPAATAGRSSIRPVATYDAGRGGLTVKSGDRVTGLIVTIADGAASLRGKVAPENESSRPPARMVVHIVPAETAAADDLLRYGEVAVGKDGAFEFKNMAPGKYRLLARDAQDVRPGDSPPAPAAWDANERAKLRKEAETMKVEVELKPCQRVTDQVAKYR